MNRRRKTETIFEQIDAFLNWTGLSNSVRGTPSLLVTILASVVILECIAFSTPIEYRAIAQPGLLILGLAIGVISVAAGDLWDQKIFDPRYGLQGTRLTSPSGSDLKHYRDRAIEKLKPISSIDPATGARVYRESEKIVKKSLARWAQVEGPLNLSKFARNFILPFLIAAFLLFATFLWKVRVGADELAMLYILSAAVACLIVGLLLFVPYIKFRIEHMIRLYSEVVEILDRKTST